MAEGDKMIPKKSGVSNAGLKYETQIIATLAARWGNNDKVEDFWIATSLPSVDCFDDINAIVIYKDKRKYLFMIQLKHSGKNMKLVFENTRKQRDFFAIELHKYKSAYDKITAGDFSDILKEKVLDISDENKYYCIFTIATKTRELAEKVIAKDDPLELLDISDRRMYSKWENSVPPGYDQFFNRLYFLTDQLNSESIPELLHRLMPAGFNYAMMSTFFNLVENANPLTTNIYSQQCVDVQMWTKLKISKIFKDFEAEVRIKEEFLEMWDQIFNNYDVIIIDKEEISKISSMLSSYYEYKIRKKYSNSFDWNACCENNFQLNEAIGQGLTAENEKLKFKHLGDLIQHMWNKSEIPVMLEQDQTRILTDPILNKAFVGKRFILTSECETISFCENIKKVTSIADLKESGELIRNIFAIEIPLQGRSRVPIGKIVDNCSDILKTITLSHLFNWTSTYQEIPSVGKKLSQPEEKYIQRNIDGATNKRELSEKQFIQQLSHGLNVISNDAGMGKTTVLTSLAFQCEAADYVIYYNLADCIQSIQSKELNDSPIDYFFKKQEGENCSKLIKSIYESQKATQRVILIIDSFDEISLDYKKEAFEMLVSLLKYKMKFLITTRSYVETTLKEKYPNLKLFHLRELTEENIKTYLNKCNLPKTIYEIVDTHFLMTPLHLSMIASITDDVITENTTRVNLYEMFIERKIDVYCQVKGNMSEGVRKSNYISNYIHEIHVSAALKFIFNVDMNFEKVFKDSDMCVTMGIISSVNKDSVQFQHHTYAEYIAAKWIHANPEKSSKLCWQVITDEKYAQVCAFLTEIRNKEIDCTVILNNHELLRKDQWGLFPIHWALAILSSAGVFEGNIILSLIERVMICMLHIQEICDFRSPNLNSFGKLWLLVRLYEWHHLKKILHSSSDMCQNDTSENNPNHLSEACFNGNVNVVRSLLREGANVNQVNRHGATSLHAACLQGHEEVARVLLKHKADPNKITNRGISSLHNACIGEHEKIVRLLLAHNADPNHMTNYGSTCLHIASSHRNADIVRYLLENNADVTQPDIYGMTSLHIACEKRYLDILTILLQHKVDPNTRRAKCAHSWELQRSQVGSYFQDCVHYYWDKNITINVDGIRRSRYETALHIACRKGYGDIVNALLEHRADPNIKDANNENCLYVACLTKHEMFKMKNLMNIKKILELFDRSTESYQSFNLYNSYTSAYSVSENINFRSFLKKKIKVNLQNTQGEMIQSTTCNPDININDGNSLHTTSFVANENIVRQLLAHNANANLITDYGSSSLHAASYNGNVNVARYLLEKIVDVNQQDKGGRTSLSIACRRGCHDIVSLLLEYKGDLNIQTNDDRNSLHAACYAGHKDIILQLPTHNADLYQVRYNGRTCLHEATLSGNVEIVRLLLQKNLDVNQQDKNGTTSLHLACMEGYDEIVSILLEHKAEPNIQNDDDENSLYIACNHQNESIVLQLLAHNADPNQVNCWDNANVTTCLLLATLNANVKVVRYLLQKNVDVNRRNDSGETSLHIACKKGHDEIVSILLEHQADPNIQNNDGANSLYAAITYMKNLHITTYSKEINIIRCLLQKNVEVNLRDKSGATSLHIACKKGYDKIVSILLEHHADPNIQNNGGANSLNIACRAGHENIVLQLFAHDANPYQVENDGMTCLHAATYSRKINIIRCLLQKNVEVNLRDKSGATSLHIACKKGNDEIVNILLEYHADPNIQNNDGDNSLNIACRGGHEDIVSQLFAHNANPYQVNNNGMTCLHLATYSKKINIVRCLLQKNIDVNRQDKTGETSLHIACRGQYDEIVSILLEHHADPNIQNNGGVTSLYIAEQRLSLAEQLNIVSQLLDHY